MNIQQAYNEGMREVRVLSYGYMDRSSVLSEHFEPFRHKRSILFKVDEDLDPTNQHSDKYGFSYMWFDHVKDEDFYLKEGIWYCDGPDISYKYREEYDEIEDLYDFLEEL